MRIFFKDSSGLKEISKEINNYKSDTYIATITAADAIYIGSDFPLNHFFVKLGNGNEETSAMEVSYWDGDILREVVNLNDYTDAFTNSGFVEFTPDRDHSWCMEDTKSSGSEVTGLETVTVYDKYWTRITFSDDLSEVELKWIGHLFSDDMDLFSEFPIFNDQSFMTGFEAGKTSWEEQHVKAAELLIQELKRKRVIIGAEQILDKNILMPAAVAKCAEIIYNAFGNDYAVNASRAKAEFSNRIDLSRFSVDSNSDGILDRTELKNTQGWLSR